MGKLLNAKQANISKSEEKKLMYEHDIYMNGFFSGQRQARRQMISDLRIQGIEDYCDCRATEPTNTRYCTCCGLRLIDGHKKQIGKLTN